MAKRSAEYERGRRDGLRLAIETIMAEEQKWAATLGTSKSPRTNEARKVRHKAFDVALSRLRTTLGKITPRDETRAAEIAEALERAGL